MLQIVNVKPVCDDDVWSVHDDTQTSPTPTDDNAMDMVMERRLPKMPKHVRQVRSHNDVRVFLYSKPALRGTTGSEHGYDMICV